MGWVVPALIALAWGDFIGALLVAGALRTTLMLHATWCVNSVAHTIGSRPYSRAISARDSLLTALITGGEGYHNFHHRFPGDYRNAIRWWQYDPTKWFIWTMSKVGLARGLQRTPVKVIAAARQQVRGADAA
jgi:stearoyl-CoA desaturase (delta-9 desaturase)